MTESERYLASLCRKAFLSLWAHANVYTDEGKPAGKGVGKELCDLLVVFDNDVVIFSDKHCEYKETGNDEVDWKRWYRKSITKSVNQLRGAASFVERFPGRIFLDKECTQPFPVAIPEIANRRVHLVAVTRGSMEACTAFFANQSIGSLRFDNKIEGDEVPFSIGSITSPWGLVHVFDEHSLDVIFRELDTVADFVGYLRKRSAFLGLQAQIVADGEEQLLAGYLVNLNEAGEHDFLSEPLPENFGNGDVVYVQEGHWESLIEDAQYRAKKEADRDSYAWDNLISRFIDTGRSDLLDIVPQEWRGDQEPAVRQMADESRFGRRILGAGFLTFLQSARPRMSSARVMRSHTKPDRAYVFLAEPYVEGFSSYDEYRAYRTQRLYAYCLVARLRATGANSVIGIAIDSPGGHVRGGSEDLLYSYEPEITDELIAQARDAQRELEILLPENLRQEERRHLEFPEVTRPAAVPVMSRQQRRAAERAAKKMERRAR
ncbi:hypothetical protein ABL849_17485 [Variovorax sp. 375MFSha3.1]|uniref:hypothetical protein n=1 Tax=Variovorax sp. 375MFSha3.1 TaxID=3158364 RepID=UPI003AAF4DAA